MRNPLVTQYMARARRIGSIRRALERDHYPRLQMMLIVMLTGLGGWLASFLMLHAGVLSMGPRYFYAMCAAYATFLLLLWVWLRLRGHEVDGSADFGGGELPMPESPSVNGHGGSFDGGGASGDYGNAATPLDGIDAGGGYGESLGDTLGSVGDKIGSVGDVDVGEAAIPIAVVVLVAAILFSSLFMVYSAPLLLSELLVDGVLAASLYRRLRGLDRRHWLETALRRTMWPFIMTALVVTACGWAMGRYAPEAHSLGQVLQHQAAPVDD